MTSESHRRGDEVVLRVAVAERECERARWVWSLELRWWIRNARPSDGTARDRLKGREQLRSGARNSDWGYGGREEEAHDDGVN